MAFDALDWWSAGIAAYHLGTRAMNGVHTTLEGLRARNVVLLGGRGAERLVLANALARSRPEIVDAWARTQFDPARLRRYGVHVEELPPREELAASFLVPLFEVLRAYVRSGEARYAGVYLDERLRYAPHQAAPAVRQQFFDEVLAADEDALVAAVDAPLRATLSRALHELHAPLRALEQRNPLGLLALGDCLINEVRVALVSRCRAEGLPLDFRAHYFSAGKDGISTGAPLALLRDFSPHLVSLSFFSYRGLLPFDALMRDADTLSGAVIARRVDAIASIMRGFLSALRERTDAPFIVHNASGLPLSPVRRFVPVLAPLSRRQELALSLVNAAASEVVANTPRAIALDEHAIARRHGLRACLERVVPVSVVPRAEFHTARFGEFLVPAYLDVLQSYRALSRAKVLAVDFDDTLWDGVMADGPVTQRHGLQRTLRRLKDGGIVLVALSKNDPRNIRWGEMTLKPEDFVLQKIGWELKVKSLQEAAQQLDLALDSFVVLDDNPAERELVRTQLPRVETLDPHAPTTAAWLERMLAFPNTRETEEARQRTELYRQQVARKAALQPQLDYPSMMASLELRATFGPARKADLDRIAELVQRTNQFNTTTVRHSKQQLLEMLGAETRRLYTATLADRFGAVGLVAVVVVRRDGPDRVIESFVMSCRAMGFGLEQLALARVVDAERGPGVRFVGRYVPSARNSPCSGLYEQHGFVRLTETEWALAPDAPRPTVPAWFR
jgi:FkbH-like protein